MSSNDPNEIPFCPARASIPGVLSSDEENKICEFPQHPPTIADSPHDHLISAIRKGDFGTVKFLLDKEHILWESLLYKTEDIAKLLIQGGASINPSKNYFRVPLHLAVENGYTEVVSMLLERAALVDATDFNDETALHRAVEAENLKIIELLLNEMANIEAKSRDGLTPLHMALNKLGRARISEDRFDHALESRCKLCTSNPEVTMNPTLETKSVTSSEEVAILLLDHGADVDARNNDGKTVLQVAVERCNFRIIVKTLPSREHANGSIGKDCLSIAVKSAGPADREELDLLVDHGFTFNRRDAKDSGLLHHAVRNGFTKIVDDLLKLGANVRARLWTLAPSFNKLEIEIVKHAGLYSRYFSRYTLIRGAFDLPL